MPFMQAEGAQEQGGGSVTPDSGDTPIIVDDDTDTYYNISFKDLINIYFTDYFFDLVYDQDENAVSYGLFLMNDNSAISTIDLANYGERGWFLQFVPDLNNDGDYY